MKRNDTRRHLIPSTLLGLGLTVALLLVLAPAAARAQAEPPTYYVRESSLGDCLSVTTPCSTVRQALALIPSTTNGPAEIHVAGGIYTENLVLTRSVRLRGGWNVSFTHQQPLNTPTIIEGGLFTHTVRVMGDPTARISLEHLTLRHGIDGVHVWGGRVTVTHGIIWNVSKQGLEIDGGDVFISRTHILTAQQGIEVDGGTIRATGVRIAHTSGEGLLVERGGTVTLTHSTIEDCAQQGVQMERGRLWLLDNHITGIDADGVKIEVATYGSTDTFHIAGNAINTVQSDGLDVQGGGVIRDNVIHHTANRGIRARATDPPAGHVTISGNTIHDTGSDGVRVDRGQSGTVRQNTVYRAGGDGIDVRFGGNIPVTITQNTVSECASAAGIQAEGADHAGIRIEANRLYSNGVGITLRGLDPTPVFTVINNFVLVSITRSVEISNTGTTLLAHNTLAVPNHPTTQSLNHPTAITAAGTATATLVNNVVVSHAIGITAAPGTVLSVSHTLLWGNGADPISGTHALLAPPRFADPARHDVHLRSDSPAIDAGIPFGGDGTDFLTDIDSDPRPQGSAPDLGADEFRTYFVYLPLVLRNHPPPPPTPDLAVYHLYADPAGLAWLAEQPLYQDETIPATFVHGRSWDVDVRYRGDTSRLMPKKCWKVFFPGADLFQDQEEVNLNADYVDQALLRSYLGYDLFTRTGVPAPRGGYGPLYINDVYYGLMSQAEQIDELFLHRQGIEIHGNLYKPYYGNLGALDYITDPEKSAWWYNHYYPKKTNRDGDKTDIVDLIETINHTPDDAFPETITRVMDVNEWLDWYAVNILIGNFEMMDKNYYLYHDLSRERWMILPWDVDLAMGHNAGPGAGGYGHLLDEELSWDNPIDSGTQESKKVDGKWNVLIDRMMNVPDFRFYHCRRLTEIIASVFSPGEMFPRIDAAYQTIRPWAEADGKRWRPDDFQFSEGPAELKTYVANRIQFLENEIATTDFCPDRSVPLTINELMIGESETGNANTWLEIHNGSPILAWDAGGMYLSTALTEPRQWRIPVDSALIPPGGTLWIRAGGQTGGNGLHADIALDSNGGQIGLFDKDVFGNGSIDVLTYSAQLTGTAYGRWPDGADTWGPLDTPTPGWLNQGRPPVVSDTYHTPAWPVAGAPFTITSTIVDSENQSITVTLRYWTFAPYGEPSPHSMSMAQIAPGSTTWHARLPAQPVGTWVEYEVEATDAAGMTTVDRSGWPQGRYRIVVGWQRPPLYINEVMALNTHTVEDGQGETDDWIEIYNAGPVAIDLGGMYVSDSHNLDHQVSRSARYTISSGVVVPAGGYRLLWADGDGVGAHLNFRLSGAGEYVGLFDSQANHYAPIDAVYFDPQRPDVSWGRFDDGEEAWHAMDDPTPGAPNRLHPPRFLTVTRTPRWPAADQTVAVSAVITAGISIVSADLWIDTGDGVGFQATSMTQPVPGGVLWQGTIPSLTVGTPVSYYLSANDSVGQHTVYPPSALAFTERYVVGHTPPAVVINEFLAANTTVNRDEAGEYDDWLELYNAGPVTESLGGMYLTDDLTEPRKWQIPLGTALTPAGKSGAHLLIWCDRDLGQGPLHATFKLNREGEEIGLFAPSSSGVLVPLDWIVFDSQLEDISYGRQPDGADDWRALDPPTPGW